METVIFMSSCGISEWEVEDPQEFDVAENHLGRLLQILDKGENPLAREILDVVNYGIDPDMDGVCFCQVKVTSNKWVKIHRPPKWGMLKWRYYHYSTVWFYTNNFTAIERLIGKVTGTTPYIVYSGIKDDLFETLPKGEHVKIGFSWDELRPFLVKTLQYWISDIDGYLTEWMENQPG